MSVVATLCSSRTGTTWIGSDTMVCSGNIRRIIGPKWVVRWPWAVGIAGHLRTINVVRQCTGELLENLSDAYEFAERAREFLRKDGYHDAKDNEGPLNFGQMLMLARPDKAWAVGTDFSVLELPVDTLWAEGSGRELALGAAYGLQCAGSTLPERNILEHALEAAILHDATCGGNAWSAELRAQEPSAGQSI